MTVCAAAVHDAIERWSEMTEKNTVDDNIIIASRRRRCELHAYRDPRREETTVLLFIM